MENIFPNNYDFESWYASLGYLANGTSQDYYYAKHGTLAFTFEGRYGSEDERLPEHVAMWDGIFGGATRNRDMALTMILSLAIFWACVFILTPTYGNHGLWAAMTIFMLVRSISLTLCYPALERSISRSR